MSNDHGLTRLEKAIQFSLDRLDAEPNQVVRAKAAGAFVERMRQGLEEFGDQRSAAFQALRDDDWSLADMKEEFKIARQRISQMLHRETDRERQKRLRQKGRAT